MRCVHDMRVVLARAVGAVLGGYIEPGRIAYGILYRSQGEFHGEAEPGEEALKIADSMIEMAEYSSTDADSLHGILNRLPNLSPEDMDDVAGIVVRYMENGNSLSRADMMLRPGSEWQGSKGKLLVVGSLRVLRMTIRTKSFNGVPTAQRNFLFLDPFGNYYSWITNVETKSSQAVQVGQEIHVEAKVTSHTMVGGVEVTRLNRLKVLDEVPRLPGEVRTELLEIPLACVMEVEAGTNCPMGGDAGHGGLTVVTLADLGGTIWDVDVIASDGTTHHVLSPYSVRIVARGDSESDALACALEFAAKAIRRRSGFDPDEMIDFMQTGPSERLLEYGCRKCRLLLPNDGHLDCEDDDTLDDLPLCDPCRGIVDADTTDTFMEWVCRHREGRLLDEYGDSAMGRRRGMDSQLIV